MENEMDTQDALEPVETQDSTLETEEVVSEESPEVVALKEQLQKAEEVARNQKIRAEKAEKALKKPVEVEASKNNVLSKKEQILEARALNSLHEDDIDEVVAIAEAKGISLFEAVKNPYVKTFIKTREEERKTAEVVSIGNSRKTSKSDGSSLIKKAESGRLDPDEMKEAARAMIESVFSGK